MSQMQCMKHPNYKGGTKPDWTCRACRLIRKEAKVTPTLYTESGWAYQGDKAEVSKTTKDNIRTLKDLIRICEIDTKEWEVERYVCNKWEVAAKDAKDNLQHAPLYQVKAWLKRKTALIDARNELEELKSLFKKGLPSKSSSARGTPRRLPTAKDAGLMLEINIPDLHLGKLAWGPETGWADYDGDKAEALFEDALDMLLERTVSYKFDQILFPLGNDILHSDTKFGTTTHGTQLDTDSRYQKNFARVRNLSIRSIDRLRCVAETRVIMVPGNHDTLSVWHLGDSLECYYHETRGITIDNEPCLRKYHKFGACMLMLTHGNRGKLTEYPNVMAAEQREMWGSTVHREAHTGDKHHVKVHEIHGTKVRILPALCPPDAWHSEYLFVGAKQSAEAFIWHAEDGLIGTAIYNVKEVQ